MQFCVKLSHVCFEIPFFSHGSHVICTVLIVTENEYSVTMSQQLPFHSTPQFVMNLVFVCISSSLNLAFVSLSSRPS